MNAAHQQGRYFGHPYSQAPVHTTYEHQPCSGTMLIEHITG